MNKEQANKLAEYLNRTSKRISLRASDENCDRYSYKTDLSNGYSIEIKIKKNVKKKVKVSPHSTLPKWYLTLSDELYKIGASPNMQVKIPNAFLRVGYSNLGEVKLYCELVEYGKNMAASRYTKYGAYRPRNIGDASFELLKKVFEEK